MFTTNNDNSIRLGALGVVHFFRGDERKRLEALEILMIVGELNVSVTFLGQSGHLRKGGNYEVW
jgi:hypothetical protein